MGLLQINILVVENPRVNGYSNVEIIEFILCWITIRNLCTYVEDIVNFETIDAVTLDNAGDVLILDNLLVVCLTSLEHLNVVCMTELSQLIFVIDDLHQFFLHLFSIHAFAEKVCNISIIFEDLIERGVDCNDRMYLHFLHHP